MNNNRIILEQMAASQVDFISKYKVHPNVILVPCARKVEFNIAVDTFLDSIQWRGMNVYYAHIDQPAAALIIDPVEAAEDEYSQSAFYKKSLAGQREQLGVAVNNLGQAIDKEIGWLPRRVLNFLVRILSIFKRNK